MFTYVFVLGIIGMLSPEAFATPSSSMETTHAVQSDQPRPESGYALPPGTIKSPEQAQAVARQQEKRKQFSASSFALVAQTGAVTTYSRAINKVTCVARGTSGSVEWLGTKLGVKRVDTRNNTVRIFGPRDGLPWGEVLAIATDTTGSTVTALVMPHGKNAISFINDLLICVFDPISGKWRVLDTVKGWLPTGAPSDDLSAPMPPPYYLAITSRYIVALAPDGTGLPVRDTVLLYDRTTSAYTRTILPWNETLQGGYGAVQVGAVAQVQDTLYLATPKGLFSFDTAKPFDKKEPFHCFLPEYQISQLAASPSGKFLALLAVKRLPGKSDSDSIDLDSLLLYQFSLPDGALSEPLLAMTGQTQGTWRRLRGILSIADDDTIWLTNRMVFARYESTPSDWQFFDDHGETIDPRDRRVTGRWTYPVLSDKPLASANTVPDNAVLARILRSSYQDDPRIIYTNGDMTPTAWFRFRFGRWLSPNARTYRSPDSLERQRAVVDPVNPKIAYRLTFPNALLLMATEANSQTARPIWDDTAPNLLSAPPSDRGSERPKELARYPVFRDVTTSSPPNGARYTVERLVVSKTDVFLVGRVEETPGRIVLIRWNKKSRRAVVLNGETSGIAGLRGSVTALQYDGDAVWLSLTNLPNGEKGSEGTYRYDEKAQRFIRVLAEPTNNIAAVSMHGGVKQVYLVTQRTLRRWLPSGKLETLYPAAGQGTNNNETVDAFLANDRYLYLGVSNSTSGQVYRATNGGSSSRNWHSIGNVPPHRIESLFMNADATGEKQLWITQHDTRTRIEILSPMKAGAK